jgi:hypothetical protein
LVVVVQVAPLVIIEEQQDPIQFFQQLHLTAAAAVAVE